MSKNLVYPLLVGCLACGPAAPTFGEADRQAILDQHTTFAAAVDRGDYNAAVRSYEEGAVLLPPNAPRVVGKIGIIATFESMGPMGDLKLWGDEFYASGDLVVVSGNYAMNLLPPGSALAIADTGKYLEVWRRQLGGSWLIAWETFNSSLPVPDLSTGS